MALDQFIDVRVLSGAVAFEFKSVFLGMGSFVISRSTLQDVQGGYLDSPLELLRAFEQIKVRIARAAEGMMSGARLMAPGKQTIITNAEFRELY